MLRVSRFCPIPNGVPNAFARAQTNKMTQPFASWNFKLFSSWNWKLYHFFFECLTLRLCGNRIVRTSKVEGKLGARLAEQFWWMCGRRCSNRYRKLANKMINHSHTFKLLAMRSENDSNGPHSKQPTNIIAIYRKDSDYYYYYLIVLRFSIFYFFKFLKKKTTQIFPIADAMQY